MSDKYGLRVWVSPTKPIAAWTKGVPVLGHVEYCDLRELQASQERVKELETLIHEGYEWSVRELNERDSSMEKLKVENAKLREVLEFYAGRK